jgi:hypothetical protein
VQLRPPFLSQRLQVLGRHLLPLLLPNTSRGIPRMQGGGAPSQQVLLATSSRTRTSQHTITFLPGEQPRGGWGRSCDSEQAARWACPPSPSAAPGTR